MDKNELFSSRKLSILKVDQFREKSFEILALLSDRRRTRTNQTKTFSFSSSVVALIDLDNHFWLRIMCSPRKTKQTDSIFVPVVQSFPVLQHYVTTFQIMAGAVGRWREGWRVSDPYSPLSVQQKPSASVWNRASAAVRTVQYDLDNDCWQIVWQPILLTFNKKK